MKKLLLLAGISFWLCPFAITAQEIVTLYEAQFYDAAVPDSNQVANAGIVDINSDLIVRIDKMEVMRRMGELFPVQKNIWANIDELTALLRNQNEILQLFNQSLEETDDAPNFDLYSQLAFLQLQFLEDIQQSPFLLNLNTEAEDAYLKKYGRFPAASDPPQELFILQYFAEKSKEYAEAAAAKAEETFTNSDVRFLMAGFLISNNDQRPIHLNKRVDTYEPEAYVVPRWVYTLSEGDLEELQAAADVAESLQNTSQISLEQIIQLIQNTIASDDCLATLQEEFDKLQDRIPAISQNAQQQIENLVEDTYSQLERALLSLKALQGENEELSSMELLSAFNQNVSNCRDNLVPFGQSFTTNFQSRLETIADSVMNQLEIDNLLSAHAACLDAIQADLELLDQLGGVLGGVIAPSAESAQATLEITDNIRRLRPNEIPEQFTLRLSRTGRRANGDQIEILALAEVPGAEDPLLLETRFFTMQQIEIYSEAKVMVTLANPFAGNGNIDLESEFQFAPSYSVLFRWGSRKSKAWNNFWNVGIGLNFAAPDFDTDGIPEFGAGLVVTSFKDFVSTGLSYNFGVGAPYYFVGFRVPFTSTVLPVLNSVDVESGGY